MSEELKPCPCGKTPTALDIVEGDTFRWRIISGDCCGEWRVETRVTTIGENANPEHHYKQCVEAWNEAPRHTPEGCALVPVEPTEAMLGAAWLCDADSGQYQEGELKATYEPIYKAMLKVKAAQES